MEDLFRSIAIGLGVLMGTFQAGLAPELQLAVHKANGQLIVSGGLDDGMSQPMEEALAAGVSMALSLRVEVAGRETVVVTKTLSYQPLTKQWVVSGPGESSRSFRLKVEAEAAWFTWTELAVGSIPAAPFSLAAEVTLDFIGRPDWKADMVWKVPTVFWRKEVARLSEIPN